MTNVPIRCPKCGSKNTKVQRYSGDKLLDTLLNWMPGGGKLASHSQGGSHCVICKDCGAKSILQIM